jgi:hypothetical protein
MCVLSMSRGRNVVTKNDKIQAPGQCWMLDAGMLMKCWNAERRDNRVPWSESSTSRIEDIQLTVVKSAVPGTRKPCRKPLLSKLS